METNQQNIKIDVHHLTRVEGHGNIVVNINQGTIEKCEWQVPEAPRFFEAMVRGCHFSEVARVTSRICGICAIGHTLASCKATEDALGITISPQSHKMRTLLKLAETFDSHVVHVLFLVAPDLFGVPSVFPLVPTHGEVVKKALRLKRFGHEWGALIAGRSTHPTSVVPGGFADMPHQREFVALRKRFDAEILPDLKDILSVLLSVADRIPAFKRETEYVAIHSDTEYGLYDGDIQCVTPDGKKERLNVSQYRQVTNEYMTAQSTAKFCKHKLPAYMAGALARFNNNFDQLHPEAKGVAKALNLAPLCFNPYLNNAAQVVEIVHSVHEGMRLLDELLAAGIKDEELVKPTKFGEGFGMVEVPRGILFHNYVYNREHICQSGNCIIPTNQNHGNIQLDFDKLVPELLKAGKGEKEMELALEMLVRAYDPCISCSTHYLKVKFVR